MSILHTPIKVNQLNLHNRLIMPPMATQKTEGNGLVTDALCDYYSEKSQGGHISLIIAEHCYVSMDGKASLGQVSIADDTDIDGLKKLVLSIQKNNTKVMAQINHAGAAAKFEITDTSSISASSIRMQKGYEEEPLPTEMSKAQINKVIEDFTNAAIRAKKADFDGVEIHSAHGYLLNQFYSPLTNKRTDKYNGFSIEGRTKLHLEIIQSIRDALGKDYPLALRLGACDYMLGGSTIQDSVIACKLFEEASVDLLDISGGFCGYTNPTNKAQGYFAEITKEIKKEVRIPVILTGGIIDIQTAHELLKQEASDLIGVGRAILKDSNWAKDSMCKVF